ncbi:tyrosine phosphatase [Cordyceps javanica]|uniref:Tyrosine phosphatase n=1 Tax=Cordyceps javanica TaxID=43265 RepID=A0A545VG30_9HYPO|nr:tyrosine phosphatase [Cordyceps javanica]TQW11866.1 tyrosine phosphatase [Cordyceps javanica]
MPTDTAAIDALAATDVRTVIPPEQFLPVLTAAPFVASRSMLNLRDAGAVPGSAIPPGRVYRCGTLEYAAQDPEALAWLAGHVRRVYDLRREGAERDGSPDPAVPGVENVWLPARGSYPTPALADFAAAEGVAAWRTQYLNVALAYGPTFRAVLEHVRDTPREPILFHCSAGRDRTGVLAGLLHHLAGSPPEAAIRDYMLSRIGIEPVRDKLMPFAMNTVGITDPETPGFYNLVQLRPEYWNAFLDALDERFSGWDGYVTSDDGLGLSKEDLETIKANLRTV